MTVNEQATAFIKLLREVDPRWMRATFTNGACFELSRMLRVIWPDAEPWIAEWTTWQYMAAVHVFTRIGTRYYDIRGGHRLETVKKYASKKRARFRRMNATDEVLALEMNPRRLRAT